MVKKIEWCKLSSLFCTKPQLSFNIIFCLCLLQDLLFLKTIDIYFLHFLLTLTFLLLFFFLSFFLSFFLRFGVFNFIFLYFFAIYCLLHVYVSSLSFLFMTSILSPNKMCFFLFFFIKMLIFTHVPQYKMSKMNYDSKSWKTWKSKNWTAARKRYPPKKSQFDVVINRQFSIRFHFKIKPVSSLSS